METADWSTGRIRIVTALLLFGIFLLGTITGAGLVRLGGGKTGAETQGGQRPPPRGAGLPGPFSQLGLSVDQTQRAEAILAKHRPELEATVREVFPKVRAINAQIEGELRGLLTPEQAARLELLQPPPRGDGQLPGAGGPFGMPLPGMGPPGGPPAGPHGPPPPGMGPPGGMPPGEPPPGSPAP